MPRAAWLVAVALVTGTFTAALVRAQIDARRAVSTDAQVQIRSMSVGAAYAQSPIRSDGVDLLPVGSEAVPAGKEFVILQVTINAGVESGALAELSLESRFPKPNYEKAPIVLTRLALDHPEDTERIYTLKFPDGTVVVDAGRMPWVSVAHVEQSPAEDSPDDESPASAQALFPPVSILGYYRVKPRFEG